MPIITIKNCLNCGIAHEWSFSAPTLKELREIKNLTGMSGGEFTDASENGDPDALAALICVLHKRDRITVPYDDVDLDFEQLDVRPTPEEKAAADKASLVERTAAKTGEGKGHSPRNGPRVKAG